MTQFSRTDLITAGSIAAVLTASVVLVAVGVQMIAAAEGRQLLQFGFSGIPRRPSEVWAIWTNNERVLLAILAATGVARAAIRAGDSRLERVMSGSLRALCDAALVLGALVQIAIIGTALGSYGARALWPILPHLPFELGAFSLALALYHDARRRRLAVQRLLVTAGAATVLLAIGAVLEVFA